MRPTTVLAEKDSLNLGNLIKERVFVMFGKKYRSDIVNGLHYKMKIIDFLIILFAWTGGLLAITSCENNMNFTFYPDPNDQVLYKLIVITSKDDYSRRVVNAARVTNSILTAAVIILLYFHYKYFLEFQKMKMNIKPEMGLISSGYWKNLLLEVFLNIWHCPPLYKESYVLIPQRNESFPPAKVFVDNILTVILIFCRAYHVVKFAAFHSQYNKYESEKICLECNTPMDFLFLIKAEFKTRPFSLVGVIMVVSIFVFGYSVRSIEMFFMFGGDPSKIQDWRYYWNGMWCVIITMSTVGFGDYYPISLLGRGIIVIACFWGTFLISLMVAALTVAVEFNPQEAVSYDYIKTAHNEMEYGQYGTIMLQTSLRYRFLIKKLIHNPELSDDPSFRFKRSQLFNKLRETTEIFRTIRKVKGEKLDAMYLEYAINKIDENLTVEMDKIRIHTALISDIRYLLDEYEKNQILLKQRTIELYKEIEEVNIFKEKYLKH